MTFEEIFEQDAKWLLGRHVLTDIVNYIKGRPLIAIADTSDRSKINIEIPLPSVIDELSGEHVSILYTIPPELIGILLDRLNEAMSAYLGDGGKQMLNVYIRSANTQYTLTSIQNELSMIERSRQAIGEGELWQVVADHIGIQRIFQLPDHEIVQFATIIQRKLPADCEANYITPFSSGARNYRIEVPYDPSKHQKLEVEDAMKEFTGNRDLYVDWVVVSKKP
ncbi:MAG TPA: hypothetical protein VHP34_11680 [Alphaproteobacteria bacterium]|nr:hypothetical protein [Alphaproteobacteria bacterium]